MKGDRRAHVVLASLLIALSLGLAAAARGEEAGVGHYIPGATSSFIDMLPDRGTSLVVVANAFTYFEGSASPTQELEFGGLLFRATWRRAAESWLRSFTTWRWR